jgi:hypothetical protein
MKGGRNISKLDWEYLADPAKMAAKDTDMARKSSVESDTPSAARRKSPALIQSRAGDIRVGPILAIPAVLDELGVDPQRAFAQAKVYLSHTRFRLRSTW